MPATRLQPQRGGNHTGGTESDPECDAACVHPAPFLIGAGGVLATRAYCTVCEIEAWIATRRSHMHGFRNSGSFSPTLRLGLKNFVVRVSTRRGRRNPTTMFLQNLRAFSDRPPSKAGTKRGRLSIVAPFRYFNCYRSGETTEQTKDIDVNTR